MLTLLLMFLAFAGIHSLPLQENCTETETEFHNCLSKLNPHIIHSIDMRGYESQKSAFIQCGAKHSDCYLQKTVITMVESLIQELKEGKVDDEGYPTHNYDEAGACLDNLSREFKAEFLKEKSFNKHGFRLAISEIRIELAKYIVAAKDTTNCTKESIDEWIELIDIFINASYQEKMTSLWWFVRMNGTMNEKESNIFPVKLIQPFHCIASEKKFKDCVQKKEFLPSDYQTRRKVFVECGAKESDCYLQQHLMKMISIINDTVVGFDDIEIGGTDCPEEPDNIRLECMRPGFDKYGFPKPDREFDYYNEHCKAEHWQRVRPRCIVADWQVEVTLMKYNIAIKDFAIYLGLIEEDVEGIFGRSFGIGK